jgi:hypothetical protein
MRKRRLEPLLFAETGLTRHPRWLTTDAGFLLRSVHSPGEIAVSAGLAEANNSGASDSRINRPDGQ